MKNLNEIKSLYDINHKRTTKNKTTETIPNWKRRLNNAIKNKVAQSQRVITDYEYQEIMNYLMDAYKKYAEIHGTTDMTDAVLEFYNPETNVTVTIKNNGIYTSDS